MNGVDIMESHDILKGKIKQTTVVKTILDTFKVLLLNKELKPGSRLPSEKEMVEQFGVGKSSVREAIKMLDAVGIIESKQGLGTFVCNEPKEDSLNPLIFQLILQQGTERELLSFRKMYETGYTFMAMDSMTEQDKLIIQGIIDERKFQLKNGLPTTAKNDTDFHRAILKSTHNPYVIRTGEVLIELYEVTLNRNRDSFEISMLENKDYHIKIFDALCRKDKKALREVLDESYEDYAQYYIYE